MAEAVDGAAATATGTAEAEAPAVPAEAEPCVKEKAPRGAKGLPPHVIESKLASGAIQYQARLRWLPQGADKKRYDPIPGVRGTKYFATPEDAASAQAAAQQLLETAGALAVWPDGLPGEKLRAARGTAPPRSKGIRKAKADKAPGIGRGNNPKSHGNKPHKQEADRLRTVPLPADREAIDNECVREFLVEPNVIANENAVPAWAQPPLQPLQPLQPLPPIPVALGPEE